MELEERTWKSITMDLDLYKFYIDLLIKAATFSFAICGGIVAWSLSHQDIQIAKYSNCLPLIISAGFVVICFSSIKPTRRMIVEFKKECKMAGFEEPYDLSLLTKLLYVFGISYALVAIGLLYVLCWM